MSIQGLVSIGRSSAMVSVMIMFFSGCGSSDSPLIPYSPDIDAPSSANYTVVGDSVYWIDDVAVFMDEDSIEWRLERVMTGSEVSVDIYQDDVLASSVVVEFSGTQPTHLRLADPESSAWVEVNSQGEIYSGSSDWWDSDCEPSDPELMVLGAGDECDCSSPGGPDPDFVGGGDCDDPELMEGLDEDPCEDELKDAEDAIELAWVTLGTSVGVLILTAGVFIKPATFATGLATTNAGYRLGKLALCRFLSREEQQVMVSSHLSWELQLAREDRLHAGGWCV